MNRRGLLLSILLSILVIGVPSIWAQDGIRGALSQRTVRARFLSTLDQQVIVADFDNDQKPDGAVLLEAGQTNDERSFKIELHLTGRRNTTIIFSSMESLPTISALDVNRDGAMDIVVEKAFTHGRLQVYLNDGHGAFQKASSKTLYVPDDAGPLWRSRVDVQNLPALFLPATSGFDVADRSAVAVDFKADPIGFCPKVLVAKCGARAPSSSRAPPSPLQL